MGYKKKDSSREEQKDKFLDLVYQDLRHVLDRFDKVHPFIRKTMLRDLAGVVNKRMKHSFKNGIEVGIRRGKVGSNS